MKNIKKFLALVVLVTLIITSCNKNVNEEENNDNEVITTVELHFTQTLGGVPQVYKWEDLDGDGGANPVVQEINLAANKTYNVEILMLDKTKSPVDTISNEVLDEAIEHRFYFIPTAASNIIVGNLTNDINGIPVGLGSVWSTGAAANGNINIVLRHYENGGKLAADLVNDTKSTTDADVTFTTKVQ